jgi:hypothetical protein
VVAQARRRHTVVDRRVHAVGDQNPSARRHGANARGGEVVTG